jgi:hypothetical protein
MRGEGSLAGKRRTRLRAEREQILMTLFFLAFLFMRYRIAVQQPFSPASGECVNVGKAFFSEFAC